MQKVGHRKPVTASFYMGQKERSARMGKFKFDVILGNPPYQEDTNGAGRQAKPVYNLFIEQAKSTNPEAMTFIIPSRWFAGGMGLDKFRNDIMNDRHISKLVDYTNAKDCFPDNSIGGVYVFSLGINYTMEIANSRISSTAKRLLCHDH